MCRRPAADEAISKLKIRGISSPKLYGALRPVPAALLRRKKGREKGTWGRSKGAFPAYSAPCESRRETKSDLGTGWLTRQKGILSEGERRQRERGCEENMPNDGDILKESQPNDVEVSAQVQLDKVSQTGDFWRG